MKCLPKSRNNFPKRKLWISLTPSSQLIPGTALPSRSALFPAAISLRKNPLRQAKRRLAVGLRGFADAVFPLHTGGNSLAGGWRAAAIRRSALPPLQPFVTLVTHPCDFGRPSLLVDTSATAQQYWQAMIGLLRGRLLEKRPNQVILDVGGVGYLVAVPLSTFAALGDLHAEVTLLIYTHVREDALALYGFLSAREKHLFELLLGASGVGPTLALKILSGMNVEELVPAIRSGDLARLTKIPGVGRKTAERMVVELKDKLESVAVEAEKPAPCSPAGVEADVKSALLNLGYDERAVDGVLADARRGAGSSNFEKLLRVTLAALSAPRASGG